MVPDEPPRAFTKKRLPRQEEGARELVCSLLLLPVARQVIRMKHQVAQFVCGIKTASARRTLFGVEEDERPVPVPEGEGVEALTVLKESEDEDALCFKEVHHIVYGA